jgi:hypothetical protein
MPPPPAVTINDGTEYEVEKILDEQTKRHRKEYLIKWMGYPEYDATWEPEHHLTNAKDVILEYEHRGRCSREGGEWCDDTTSSREGGRLGKGSATMHAERE